MKHPLIVTDLDGTLFTSQKRITERTARIVNGFVAHGGLFTIATARMPYGAAPQLAQLDLRIPGIVMNGAGLYDFARSAFTASFPIDAASARAVRERVEAAGAGCFIYALSDEQLSVAYLRDADLAFTQYFSEAARASVGFAPLGASRPSDGDVVYIAVVGDDRQINEVSEACGSIEDIRVIRYLNVYSGATCLEIASTTAGKANALRALSEHVEHDGLIVFGDNDNDLELMSIADVAAAPNTATASALAIADVVVASHDEDGVALEIARRFLE